MRCNRMNMEENNKNHIRFKSWRFIPAQNLIPFLLRPLLIIQSCIELPFCEMKEQQTNQRWGKDNDETHCGVCSRKML